MQYENEDLDEMLLYAVSRINNDDQVLKGAQPSIFFSETNDVKVQLNQQQPALDTNQTRPLLTPDVLKLQKKTLCLKYSKISAMPPQKKKRIRNI